MSEWSVGSIEVQAGEAGLEVAYAEARRKSHSSRGSGAPLVYLHGLGSSRRDFEVAAVAPELEGHRLIAVDLPGSGESRVPVDVALGIPDLVLVVEQFLAAIGAPEVHLVGHSMGGLVGLLMASRGRAGVVTFTNIEGNLAPIDCRIFSRRVITLAELSPPDEVLDRLAAEMARSGRTGYSNFAARFRSAVQPEVFVHYCRSIVGISDREPLLEGFLSLPMPRLFIHGEDNGDLSYLDDLREGGIEVVEIPKSDHFPIDSNPRRFFAALGDFIRRHALTRDPATSGACAIEGPEPASVRTPTLEIAYESHGSPTDSTIVLLHGFPDDVRAWDEVAPELARAGFRVLVPYLRGFGPTRFIDPEAPRMAQQAAIAQDLLDFIDALHLEKVALAGYDWGGRAACIAAILAPQRVRALVTVGGYNVQNTLAESAPGSPIEERAYWYQWYLNTERGRRGLEERRGEICRLLWDEWSPTWCFDDATFERTAASFDNPDFVPIVIHSYRHRHGNAPGDPRFSGIERHLAERPPITVPTVVLHGAEDTVSPHHRSESHMTLFPEGTRRQVVAGAGHFLPRERPRAVIAALLGLLESRRSPDRQGQDGGRPRKSGSH